MTRVLGVGDPGFARLLISGLQDKLDELGEDELNKIDEIDEEETTK
jgi:hypothetical protein